MEIIDDNLEQDNEAKDYEWSVYLYKEEWEDQTQVMRAEWTKEVASGKRQ